MLTKLPIPYDLCNPISRWETEGPSPWLRTFGWNFLKHLTSTLLPGWGVAEHRQQADVIPVSRHAKVRTAQEDRGQAPPPSRLLSVGILHRLCVHKHISHLNEKFFLNYLKKNSLEILDTIGYIRIRILLEAFDLTDISIPCVHITLYVFYWCIDIYFYLLLWYLLVLLFCK